MLNTTVPCLYRLRHSLPFLWEGQLLTLALEDLGFLQAALSAKWALSVLIVNVLTLTAMSKTVIHQGLLKIKGFPSWESHLGWETSFQMGRANLLQTWRNWSRGQVAGESVMFKKRLDRKGREWNASYIHRAEPSVLPVPCGSLLEGSPQHGQMVTNSSLKLQYWRQVQSV